MTDASESSIASLGGRLEAVRTAVSDAIGRAGRDESEVTTIVVTKFHPVSLIRALAEHGVSDFGESRHQEARVKAEELAGLDARWHFVGQLQGKKAKAVRAYSSVIHSVDRAALVDALGSAMEDQAVFLQVNLTTDPTRGGAAPSDAEALAERIVSTPGLALLGVMGVAPLEGEAREAFARLRAISERVCTVEPGAVAISAGMSHDFREAIAEGATHLRIGSAITGNRPPRG